MAFFVYISGDGDHIGREIGRASLADDPERLRQLSHSIEAGNEIWRSWALANGGEVISMGGDEFRLRIQAERLKELPELCERYGKTVGATISVGVGGKMSEADRALMAAKLEGGDKIRLYDPQVEEVLAEEEPKTERQKLSEAYLQKADEPSLNTPAAGGGMTGPSLAGPEAPQSPVAEGSEHSENEALQSQIENNPPPDYHQVLGDMATQQGQKDEADQQGQKEAQDKESGQKDMRQQVVGILKVFKDRSQELEQLQQQDPELYKSLVGMVQVMAALARDAFGLQQDQQQVQKSEKMVGGKGDNKPDEDFDHEQLATGIRREMEEHGLDPARAKEIAKDHLTEDPDYYTLDKAALEAGKTGRHQVKYPVGTQIDSSPSGGHDAGQLKVQDPATGKTKWRSVRAGIVMAPDGTPVSSRNPGAK